MSNEQKIQAILNLIFQKTMPKDQFGFYTEQHMYQDIANIINS